MNSQESYWIIAIPNNAGTGSAAKPRSADEEARLTRRTLDMRCQKLADNFDFRVPRLKVGTLDALMSLSDELGKIDTTVEGVLKKVKRTFLELKGKESDLLITHQTDEKGAISVPPHVYIERWEWNAAKFPVVASLKDLTARIQQDVAGVDDELRKRTSKLSEVTTAVQAIERKETGSLLVKPLGALIKAQDIIEREFITTLLVVVPKVKEEEFESTYELLEDIAAQEKAEKEREEALRRIEKDREEAQRKAEAKKDGSSSTAAAPKTAKRDAAAPAAPAPAAASSSTSSATAASGASAPSAPAAKPADAAHHDVKRMSAAEQAELQAREVQRKLQEEEEEKERSAEARRKFREKMCKNVVPRSAKRLTSDAEYTIYRILVFKKGADTIKNLCREKRYTVRAYDYDPNAEKSEQEKKVQLTADRTKQLSALSTWLVSKFSEVLIAWLHIKAIRAFTESVLRFGIPVNFQAVLIRPKKGAHSRLRQLLNEMYASLAGGNLAIAADEQSGDLASLTGGEFFPYVYLPLDLQDE